MKLIPCIFLSSDIVAKLALVDLVLPGAVPWLQDKVLSM